jgi:hypothetical protein
MGMVFHAVDNDWFLSFVFDDPRHVFENFLPPLLLQKILPSFNGKDNLNVDLGICASHNCLLCQLCIAL